MIAMIAALAMGAPRKVYVTLAQTEVVVVRATTAAEATATAQAFALNDTTNEDAGFTVRSQRTPVHQVFLASSTRPKEVGPGFAEPTEDTPEDLCFVPKFAPPRTASLVWKEEPSGSWSYFPRFIVALETHALTVEAASDAAALKQVKSLLALPIDDPKHPANAPEWRRNYCYPVAPFYASLRHGWEYVSTTIKRS